MRVLQLVQKPQRRGAEVFAFQLSEELRRQGHEVWIAYLYPYRGASPLPVGDSDFVLGGNEGNPLERSFGVNPLLLFRLCRLIGRLRPEIVQLNGGRAVKYGAFARQLMRSGSWAAVYRNIGNPGDWVRGVRRTAFYRALMRRMDGIIAISQHAYALLQEMYGSRVPTCVIPTGVDLGALQPRIPRAEVRKSAATPLEAPVVIFVGSLSREKRVDRLLRALLDVRSHVPDVHIWVIGGGPLRNALEEQVTQLRMADTVRFLGVQQDVGSFLAAADVFTLTSDTEGVPAVVVEAGYMGLPVVATRVGGLTDVVQHERTGLLVAREDEKGIAAAIVRLLQNGEERVEMGGRARQWVGANFSLSAIAAAYVRFFRTVRCSTSAQPASSGDRNASPDDRIPEGDRRLLEDRIGAA